MIRFSFDGDTVVFTGQGRGDTWNRWLRPLVDHETLTAVVARLGVLDDERGVRLDWDGPHAVIRELDGPDGAELSRQMLAPDADGRYLLDLGLTLTELS